MASQQTVLVTTLGNRKTKVAIVIDRVSAMQEDIHGTKVFLLGGGEIIISLVYDAAIKYLPMAT